MPRAPRSGRLSSLLLMAGLAFAATFSFTTGSSPPFAAADDDDVDASPGRRYDGDGDDVELLGAPPPQLRLSSSHSYCSTTTTTTSSFSSSSSISTATGTTASATTATAKDTDENHLHVDDDHTDTDTLCPPPCQTSSDRSKQCLHYLQDSHKEEVCGRDVPAQRRRDVLHRLRMPHCCEHAVDKALPEAAFHGDVDTCRRSLAQLQRLDDYARSLSCVHADLLVRYDCHQNYSIVHNCKDCKEAYRRWVCSSLVPHYARSGERKRMRPCLRVCQDVEQQCPYLLPDQTLSPGEAAHPTPQYAGEPTFLCLDPNIPETGEQRLKSSRGDEDCCYKYCAAERRRRDADADDEGANKEGRRGVLGVCEHCPGRPPNSTTTSSTPTPSATSGAALRTFFNQVSLLWTAWIVLLQTDRLVYLFVLCENGIRTMVRCCSDDWRHSCS